MKFLYYIWRYDKKSTESERLPTAYFTREEAEDVMKILQDIDPDASDAIYTVQENND